MASVITVRVSCPADLSVAVQRVFASDPATSAFAVHRGASLDPAGDVIEADLPRESVNDAVDALVALGVPERGTISLLPVPTWVSAPALRAERREPGASADAVVWTDVIQRSYDESAFTWTFASFMVLATLLAAIAIVTDSVILVIGAMVLGPEFVAIAALGVSIVRRRGHLLRQALRTLVLGFATSIAIVAAVAAVARAFGLIDYNALLTTSRPGTSFIFEPSMWSLVVAIIAGAAGVLSLTSARSGGLVGVFISVTTIPASGNIALALVFGLWHEVWGSSLTLVLNITGMAIAGWLTLAIQQSVWGRVSARRRRWTDRRRTVG
jgi:uncharacterized hydrophobic protein (TIGR00271 family)